LKFPYQIRISQSRLRRLIRAALREDIGTGDITTETTVGERVRAEATLKLKEPGVVAGLQVFASVFEAYDPKVRVGFKSTDGKTYGPGRVLAELTGRARSILTCERVALNLIQRLSGIATLTRKFVKEVEGTGAKVIDTRKTTPGLRELEKYAVLAGGGYNHRPRLSDLVLIKDNHIKAAGGVGRAVARARSAGVRVPIEVEIGPEVDVHTICDLGVDIVMLDNWPVRRLKRAIGMIRGFDSPPLIEVSGGITLLSIREIARCGPDFISVGGLTHSAPSLDISLDFRTRKRHA
jgi:nicotinate-nucleotide pyrophosphorylase (carboxylating)